MRIVTALLSISALAACSAGGGKTGLQGWQWDAVYIRVSDSTAFVAADPMPFIVFTSDTTISGNTGCNGFAGRYTLDEDGNITLSVEAMTMILCMETETEPVYIEQLQLAERYGFAGDTLVLTDPGGTAQIKFTKNDIKQ